MRSLQGKDEHFMSERQRQAELARLKREKLKAKQEDKFITAALVLGLAEKQKAAVEERLGTSHFLSRGGGGRGGVVEDVEGEIIWFSGVTEISRR